MGLCTLSICLVNVPNLNLLDPLYDPPLGLMYLASSLERFGFDVTIENLAFYAKDKWVEKLEGYDAYGFTVYTPIINDIAEIISQLKNGKVRFIAGGPHATSLPEQTLKAGFDTVIRGEGENILPKILKEKTPYRIIEARKIFDLNHLPYPARHLVPIKKFHRTIGNTKSTGIISARGCPYNCAFCSKDVHGDLRLRSPLNVVDEIKEIHSTYNFHALHFYDDTFTIRPYHQLQEICLAMKQLDIVYRCTGDLRKDDEKTLQLLFDTGCKDYCVGVESGSQKVLDAVRKETTVKRNLEVIRMAKRIGLKVKVFLMVGCPSETEETVDETIDFIETCGADEYSVFSFVPYPDCDIGKHPEKYRVKLLPRSFSEYCMVSGRGEGKFMVETEKLKADDISQLYSKVREYLNHLKRRNKA